MQKTVRVLTWIVVAVWSLLAWGSYAIVGGLGSFLMRHADTLAGGDPELTVALSWVIWFLESFGLVAVVVIWALVAVVLLALGWLIGLPFREPLAPPRMTYRRDDGPTTPPLGPPDGTRPPDTVERPGPPR